MPIPQLDWILAQYAAEHPSEIRLIRRGRDGKEVGAQTAAQRWIATRRAWEAVLRGDALEEQMGTKKIAPIREAIERMRAEGRLGVAGSSGLKPSVQKFNQPPAGLKPSPVGVERKPQ